MKKAIRKGKQNILNIAHRGASDRYPENTMAAFKGAVEDGADMVELDVRLTKDGIPVIFHNAWLDTPADAVEYIAHSALEAIKELDIGTWFHPEFADERIPTLEEVLAFAKGKINLNIELKTDEERREGRLEKACLELVEKYNMEEQVLFSSFDTKAIKRIKSCKPSIRTALLYTHSFFEWRKPSALVEKCNTDAFHCTYMQLTRRRLADLKKHNIPVIVYTVNNQSKMKELIEMGANGIITDKPELLSKVIEKVKV